jgi:nicotinamidase-related amidase
MEDNDFINLLIPVLHNVNLTGDGLRPEKEVKMTTIGPDIAKSALIIVDMQNDFLHPDGEFSRRAKAYPDRNIDMEFLASTIPSIMRLAAAFRKASRPVIYIVHILKPDYSDAAFPYWKRPPLVGKQFTFEGTWGAQIVDELTPLEGEHMVIKKGYGGFSNTPLDTILGNLGVNTCVVSGILTGVCVSSTIRGGVEYNYRMIIVSDATADMQKEAHKTEIKTLARVFADVKTTDEVIEMLKDMK